MRSVTRISGLAIVGGLCLVAAGSARSLDAQTAAPIPPALFEGLRWTCVGPFDGGPVASVEGVAGVPGVYTISTPTGGAWKTVDGGGTWTSVDRAGTNGGPDTQRWVDPANARRIARTDARGIAVSLDGGATWIESHNLPIAEVPRLTPREHPIEAAGSARIVAGSRANVSIADPLRPGLIYAGTNDGVFVSFDSGAHWQTLQLNMPRVRINDLDIRGNDLLAATQGRSIWTLDEISPLRQLSRASVPAAAILFKPSDATITAGEGVPIDYYLSAPAKSDVRLEVADAASRVVHSATSAAPDPADRWLPAARRLSTRPGQHRVVWNLRLDPPPAPHHRFAQLARGLFEAEPADPEGPRVLPGAYRVTLTVDGRSYAQSLNVLAAPASTMELRTSRQQQFELAMKAYDAMVSAHQGFLQLRRVRDQLKPLLTSSNPDVAAVATDLDTRLAAIDGSDWTGLVIPDADNDASEAEEDAKEGKHPDFVPPKAVSLSKDYDDPTTVFGRNFANVDHAPAFAILATKIGEMMSRLDRGASAADAQMSGDYATACQQLAGVLDQWRAINAGDLPRINAELNKRQLPPLTISPGAPALACAAK